MVNSSKLLTAIVLVHMFSNLLTAAYLIAFQVDQASQRAASTAKASIERQELKKQNDFLVCILQTQPADRDKAAIDTCRAETIRG